VRCVPKAVIRADAVPRDLNRPRCTGLSDHRGIINKESARMSNSQVQTCTTTEGGSSSPGYNLYEDG
jgi:hypothetical protein